MSSPVDQETIYETEKPSVGKLYIPAPAPTGNDGAASPGGLTPSETREAAHRLADDLEIIRAERAISKQDEAARHAAAAAGGAGKDKDKDKEKDKAPANRPTPNPADNDALEPFSERSDQAEQAAAARRAAAEAAAAKERHGTAALLYRFWVWLRKFPRALRYLLYMIPVAAVLLVPVLLGIFAIRTQSPIGGDSGVYLTWFGIWLEILWCGLWVARALTSMLPSALGGAASAFGSSGPKKWKEIGRQLELHAAIFIWLLSVFVSYHAVIDHHRAPGDSPNWVVVVYRVLLSLFVLSALNLGEKVCIQWIATSFHQRTYATRISNNKLDTQNLVHLYTRAKARLDREDSIWHESAVIGGGSYGGAGSGSGSGADTGSGSRTPMMQTIHHNARHAINKVGAVAQRFGNDIIGRKVDSGHPRKVVAELLRTQSSAHTLARVLYRTLVRPGCDTVYLEDMTAAFEGDPDRAEAAFSMFDKDLNNDISMEEFETVCDEIHLEKKAIAASLKDLDSVINKLDKVLAVVCVLVALIVFVSIISNSAAAALGSAGTTVLALSWMLQATAQEFLQSIIFVFIKHPFDVGDRVTIYGTTGTDLKGDDFYVAEISLLYTEFKKLGGQIVQAPNSVLNTLFILNMRRSNGIADVIELKLRFGTPAELLDRLKERMLAFCLKNRRDYQAQIITEVTRLEEVQSCVVNFVFVHKSNFQNELVRLHRHNKFAAELMGQMVSLGIQGPARTEPGGSREFPMYWSNLPAPLAPVDNPYGDSAGPATPPVAQTTTAAPAAAHYRARADSRAIPAYQGGDANLMDFQDVYDNRKENMTRLASIREKRSPLQSPSLAPLSSQLEEGGEGTASLSGLHREGTPTSGSQHRRIFGRTRTRSRTGRPSMDV